MGWWLSRVVVVSVSRVCSQVKNKRTFGQLINCAQSLLQSIYAFAYIQKLHVVMDGHDGHNSLHSKTSYGIVDGGGPTVAGEEEGYDNGDNKDTLSAT